MWRTHGLSDLTLDIDIEYHNYYCIRGLWSFIMLISVCHVSWGCLYWTVSHVKTSSFEFFKKVFLYLSLLFYKWLCIIWKEIGLALVCHSSAIKTFTPLLFKKQLIGLFYSSTHRDVLYITGKCLMLTLNPLIFRSSTSVLNHVCFFGRPL